MDLVIVMTFFTYGSNFILYLVLKEKQKIKEFEKLAIFSGVNMTILLFNGLFLLIGKLFISNLVVVFE